MKLRWLVPVLAGLFSAALEARPVDAAGWFVQGDRLYAAKDFDGALEDYTQGLRMDQRSAAGYEGAGNCLAAKGDAAGALKYYRWSLRLDPDNAVLRAYADRLAARVGAPVSLAEADRLYHEGEYDRALDAYRALTRLDPKDAWAFQGMGNAYFAEGRRKAALDQYRKALELNPGNTALAGFVEAHE